MKVVVLLTLSKNLLGLISARAVSRRSQHPDRISGRRLSHVQHHSRYRLLLRFQGPARILRRRWSAVPSVPSLRPGRQHHFLPLRQSDHFQPNHFGLRFVVQRGMQPVNDPNEYSFFSTLLCTLNSFYICTCLQISRCWKLCQLSSLHWPAALRHSPGRLHHSLSTGWDEEPRRGSANYRHQDHAGLWQETVPGLIWSSATNRISTLPTIFHLFTKFNCENSQLKRWVASVPRCLTFCFAPVELTDINGPRLQKSSRSIPGNKANSVIRDKSVNEYTHICRNKRPLRNKRPPKTVIFQRGEYKKPMASDEWFFKGGSTQNRWVLMGFGILFIVSKN